MNNIRNIVIVGSGNVATHLSLAYKQKGIDIIQVYSRSIKHARELAEKLSCVYTSEINNLYPSADLYLFAVSDSAIEPILKQGHWKGKTLVHTAGSVSIDIFKPYTDQYGVIYPLQSFTKEKNLDLSHSPFFIEGSDEKTAKLLEAFALQISSKVELANSEQRALLHLAGVFVSNFTNHMVTIAFNILKEQGLSKEAIYPLLQETIGKAILINPEKAQTGPALRNNKEILEKHIQMLQAHPEWQKIYTFVSNSIQKFHNNV
jgi:predicted short-subunit dehydrogenase-like oxidoreductase (DUF2520 family)